MARLTIRERQEIISTIYGINPRTLQVDSVSVTREGRLSRHGIGVPYHTHVIRHGMTPRAEIAIVYELEHVIEISTPLSNEKFFERQVNELTAIAKAMRDKRDVRIKPGS